MLDTFRLAAAKFIQTVDSAAATEADAFLTNMSHRLAELYCYALALPVVEPDTSGIDETQFSIEELAKLRDSLRDKLGALDAYWQVFDTTENEDPVQGTLAGDISEIYFDLKEDLAREGNGVSEADVLFDLRLAFRSHWGKHLLHALLAIHDGHIA